MMMSAPEWLDRTTPRCWHAISGDVPELGLEPTPAGTRYLRDCDPGRDPTLNPPYSLTERLRRVLGREPMSRWHGSIGFPAITEAWNSAAYASRYGASGSMIGRVNIERTARTAAKTNKFRYQQTYDATSNVMNRDSVRPTIEKNIKVG